MYATSEQATPAIRGSWFLPTKRLLFYINVDRILVRYGITDHEADKKIFKKKSISVIVMTNIH